MKSQKRNIISFYELPDDWQAEARSNLDKHAEEAHYLEPEDDHNPTEHVLWDLNEAMGATGEHEGFKYNAAIGISNNSAMLLKVSDDFEEAEFIIV